ncbi:MAG: hypothetical protein EBZ48_10935 [Proteobacteria bacterium]|nr:hypothetical protein [Pseudomonadota bacterium]
MKAQNSSSRSTKSSPPVSEGQQTDPTNLLQLPLEELVRRGGAKAGAEVFNYEYAGDEIVDKRGRLLSVIVWRNPGEDEIQGLSISHIKQGVARQVWQYSPAVHLGQDAQAFMRSKLADAYGLLVIAEKFDEGMALLQGVRRLGKMQETKFKPSVKPFSLSPAARDSQDQAVMELGTWLRFQGVKVGAIADNPGKKLGDLANEIRRGESELSVEDGAVLITSKVVLMEVVHRDERGVLQRVVETVQRFDNGFEQVRRTFGGVPGEKQLRGESVEETVMRGLHEELGIDRILSMRLGTATPYFEESSYPGLYERKFYVPVRIDLHPAEVRPVYRERTEPKAGVSGKWTVMEWRPVQELLAT